MSNLVAEIRNRFTYKADGKLYWKNPKNMAYLGKEAGGLYFATQAPHHPFKKMRVCNKWMPTHHVVWTMFNGELPKRTVIHHRNGDTLDNRIENLELYNAKSK